MNTSVTLTDPARELAELCAVLGVYSNESGDEHLATNFKVRAWSSEFYQIISCIVDRCDNLIKIVNGLEIDEDFKGEAIVHINMVQAAFGRGAMMNNWSTAGHGSTLLSGSNIQPIKMLSPLVRMKISYPKLGDEDIAKLLADTAEFEAWLFEHQIAEQDFIRQAMLDGVRQFRLRLDKIKWLGWGYTFASLREVIAAYKMLESNTDPVSNPDAEAVLKKGASFFVKVFAKVGVAKETVEKVDFLLKAYGAINLIEQGTSATGLLTHLTG